MIEEALASFAENAEYSNLSEETVMEIRRRIIDSIGVALASRDSPPSYVAKKMLRTAKGNAILIGGGRAAPDMASFYNTLLIRYLDFNDTYLSREPLHPSDMIGALYAVAGIKKTSLREFVLSIALGYEVGVRLCDAASLRTLGFDHVNFLEIATAVALAKLLHLDERRALNAISMSIVPNVALRETRVGELSMWKAGAAADASRNAVFAALMAKSGFTAPPRPLSGKYGFANLICEDVQKFDERGMRKLEGVLRTHIKKYPVEYHAQSAAEMAIEAGKEIGKRKVKRILIETYEAGKSILADEEKWKPSNKETADHSLPWIVAAGIATGDLWLDTYGKLKNKRILELMGKTEVIENSEFTARYPSSLPTTLTVECEGETIMKSVEFPRGHAFRQLTDEELDAKFLRLTGNKRLLEKLRATKEVPLIAQ